MYHIVICDDDKSYISYLKRLITECGVEAVYANLKLGQMAH